ncbi:MAG: hypothetical protein V1645_05110 [archaeon]
MANRYSKLKKKGTILLIIASLGFLIASIWLMQMQIKPKNIGRIEFAATGIGNRAQDQMYYIDKAAEYSLNKALNVKSRTYQQGLTMKEICNIQLDQCQQGKPDCQANLKLFCEDEVAKAFKEKFSEYLSELNTQTGSTLDANDYELTVKEISSNMTAKTRQIEILGKTTKTLKIKEEEIEYSIKPNFRAKAKL